MDYQSHLQGIATANSDSIEMWLFYVLAAIAIPFAYGVIFDKTIIRSGFLLIGVFGAISGLFLILQAQFLAMAQIMIYAVGITLVVVIALMLTSSQMESSQPPIVEESKVGACFFAILMFSVIYMAVRSEYWPVKTELPSLNNVEVIGGLLTGPYSLPFEFSSILLLAALMGSVMLAKTKASEEKASRAEALLAENSASSDRESSQALTRAR